MVISFYGPVRVFIIIIFLPLLLVASFFCVISYFWFVIWSVFCYYAFFYRVFSFRFITIYLSTFPWVLYTFLWGELEFLANTPFKYLILFCLGSSRAVLLDLNNLFLAFLFAGFVCLMFYLSIN